MNEVSDKGGVAVMSKPKDDKKQDKVAHGEVTPVTLSSLEHEVEYARRVALERAEAPFDDAEGVLGDDDLTATKKRLIAKGLVPDGFHVVFGLDKKHKHHVGKGCVPIIEDGVQAHVNELEAFAASDELRRRKTVSAGRFSRAALHSETMKGAASMSEADLKKLPAPVRARYEEVMKAKGGKGGIGDARLQSQIADLQKEVAAMKAANGS